MRPCSPELDQRRSQYQLTCWEWNTPSPSSWLHGCPHNCKKRIYQIYCKGPINSLCFMVCWIITLTNKGQIPCKDMIVWIISLTEILIMITLSLFLLCLLLIYKETFCQESIFSDHNYRQSLLFMIVSMRHGKMTSEILNLSLSISIPPFHLSIPFWEYLWNPPFQSILEKSSPPLRKGGLQCGSLFNNAYAHKNISTLLHR